MEWIPVKNLSLGMLEYHLVDQGNDQVILKYNTHQQVVRVQSADHYGVYFLERTGAFINKTFLKNEYGQEVGKIAFDKKHGLSGSVELERKKFQFSYQMSPSPEFEISSKTAGQPLLHAALQPKTDRGRDEQAPESETSACMILGLCWYLTLSAEQREKLEPAMVSFHKFG